MKNDLHTEYKVMHRFRVACEESENKFNVTDHRIKHIPCVKVVKK